MSNASNLKKDIKEKRELINMTMDRFLPRKDDFPKEIHKAIRYSLFAGGKRIRPYLVILTYLLLRKNPTEGKEFENVLKAAAAVEFLHTYTLIHDDLPEIDNDEYRRGKKTCHTVFGTDIALLAGDALMIEAFNILAHIDAQPETKTRLIAEMATLCGEKGLIAGQMQDIVSQGNNSTQETVEFIHLNKTAKLIKLCTRFGAILAEATPENIDKMDAFGEKLGLAFQITDDILDIEGKTEQVGKTLGKDTADKKATYPAILGIQESKEIADKYTNEALEILAGYKKRATILTELTLYLLQRDR